MSGPEAGEQNRAENGDQRVVTGTAALYLTVDNRAHLSDSVIANRHVETEIGA